MELKQVGQLIIAAVVGVGLYYFWNLFRPEDPDSYKMGVGFIGFILSYIVLYLSTKE